MTIGESLRERLEREAQLPVDEAVAIATKVAGALQHAHERGVIHRDCGGSHGSSGPDPNDAIASVTVTPSVEIPGAGPRPRGNVLS